MNTLDSLIIHCSIQGLTSYALVGKIVFRITYKLPNEEQVGITEIIENEFLNKSNKDE